VLSACHPMRDNLDGADGARLSTGTLRTTLASHGSKSKERDSDAPWNQL
jgi:hypothetical protein